MVDDHAWISFAPLLAQGPEGLVHNLAFVNPGGVSSAPDDTSSEREPGTLGIFAGGTSCPRHGVQGHATVEEAPIIADQCVYATVRWILGSRDRLQDHGT